MKEKDLRFGTAYAVRMGTKQENRLPERVVLIEKMPVPYGRTRSRIYLADDHLGRRQQIDASRFLCTWEEYEKTPEHLAHIRETVRSDLTYRINIALNQWLEWMGQSFQATFPTGKVGYMPYQRPIASMIPKDLDAAIDHVLMPAKKMLVSLPYSVLIDSGLVQMPSTEAVADAVEAFLDFEAMNAKPEPESEWIEGSKFLYRKGGDGDPYLAILVRGGDSAETCRVRFFDPVAGLLDSEHEVLRADLTMIDGDR